MAAERDYPIHPRDFTPEQKEQILRVMDGVMTVEEQSLNSMVHRIINPVHRTPLRDRIGIAARVKHCMYCGGIGAIGGPSVDTDPWRSN